MVFNEQHESIYQICDDCTNRFGDWLLHLAISNNMLSIRSHKVSSEERVRGGFFFGGGGRGRKLMLGGGKTSDQTLEDNNSIMTSDM